MAGERVIRISDLFWYIISKWKLLILVIVIGALLCGGYRYASSGKKQPADTASKAAASDGLASYDHQAANLFFRYLALADGQLDYIRTAEFMQIDPYNADVSSASFAVICDEEKDADTVLAAYEAVLTELRTQYGDLLFCSAEKGFGNYTTEDTGKTVSINESGVKTGTLMIRIYGTDEEICRSRIREITETVNESAKEIRSGVADHTLVQVGSYTTKGMSQELLDLQKAAADMMYQMTNSMNNIQKSFSPDATDYVSNMTAKGKIPDIIELSKAAAEAAEHGSEAVPEKSSVSRSPKALIKGGILGGAAALILMIILLSAYYVLSGKLRAEDDLNRLFGVGCLGIVRDPEKKERSGFDEKIEQRRFRIRGLKEETPELIAANLQIAAANAGADVLYTTGTVFGEKEKGLAAELAERLREKGIELKTGMPFMSDAASMEEAGSVGNVVFIENTDSTIRTDLAGKLAFCKENSIRVLGLIVMA